MENSFSPNKMQTLDLIFDGDKVEHNNAVGNNKYLNVESENKENNDAEGCEYLSPSKLQEYETIEKLSEIRLNLTSDSSKGDEPSTFAVHSFRSTSSQNKSKLNTPNAYKFKDIYQKNKEDRIKKILEEDKKCRVFHSRPAPKPGVMFHPPIADTRFVTPLTPEVLKRSQQSIEKKKSKAVESATNKPGNSLNKLVDASKPRDPQPFHLNLEKRLEERRRYDELYRRYLEEKKLEEEKERSKFEKQQIKEIRKKTTFKATPNPHN